MTKIAIIGSKGRMGQALISCAQRMPELKVVGLADIGDNLASAIAEADVVVDFSFHSVTAEVVQLCAQRKKAIVIGTTGHSGSSRSQPFSCD